MSARIGSIGLAVCAMAGCLLANGGPFVIHYPGGDPSAKGILGRLDPDLRPARESRLRVVEENLKIMFKADRFPGGATIDSPPLANVEAEYTIENPTAEEVEVDFGFPILRGIYTNPRSMIRMPSVHVRLGDEALGATLIANSTIYGMIRQRARRTIDKAISADPQLSVLVESAAQAQPQEQEAARQRLRDYVVGTRKWAQSGAILLAQYPGLNLGFGVIEPHDRQHELWTVVADDDRQLRELTADNLGPLSAIGEQKATQYLAYLARLLEPGATAGYEDIFKAWGGDVRELALDLESGKVRPRELVIDTGDMPRVHHMGRTDPTVYARVDYFDENAAISDSEKDACRTILKNLPVVFTFAPMNILHYRVRFAAQTTQKLTVSYSQYAYLDTKAPASYQLAYVVHPASLWKEFGPIHLTIRTPRGVPVHASVPLVSSSIMEMTPDGQWWSRCTATLEEKSGELHVALRAQDWQDHVAQKGQPANEAPPRGPVATGQAP